MIQLSKGVTVMFADAFCEEFIILSIKLLTGHNYESFSISKIGVCVHQHYV